MSEAQDIVLSTKNGRDTIGVAIVPDPDSGIKIFEADITDATYALSRIMDVQHTTPAKAPELMTVYNHGHWILGEFVSNLRYQLIRAANEVDIVKARILIDKIPQLIEEKKLPSSKDIRDALIAADPEYQAAKTIHDGIECVIEFFKVKMKALDNAFSSVKKIIDGNNYNMASKAGARVLNGIIDEGKTAGQVQGDPLFGEVRRY